MASKPSLVPETAPYLIVHGNDGEVCGRYPSKQECFAWILERRIAGDQDPFEVYAPDSRHESVTANRVVWEKSNG